MDLLLLLLGSTTVAARTLSNPPLISFPQTSNSQPNLLPAYVSLSYELDGFPAYAGTKAQPNEFSVNLLKNLAERQTYMPVSRVGGNSQDRAIYDASLQTAIAPSCANAPTAILCIGPSFFESYGAFPNTKYSHGFNLAWNNASGYATLAETVPLACKAIGPYQLDTWELGNEPDLYIGKWRPYGWNASDYTQEWINGTAHIQQYLLQSCPELALPPYFNFLAPSISGPGASLSPSAIIAAGEQSFRHPVKDFSVHNYITGSTSPGVTLQNTLLNHTRTVESIAGQVNASNLEAQSSGYGFTPYILGECNSLYGGGAAGLSNVFGSALWVLDFTLYGASTGKIHRMHYHQSIGAPYAAWIPTPGNETTEPPYYGKIAAASFLGNSEFRSVSQITLPQQSDTEVAYAGYDTLTQQLTALAVINMNEYNSTETTPRPSSSYSFQVPTGSQWQVQRLTAAGSNVQTGITFGGLAFEYSTMGKPSRVSPPEKNIYATQGILPVTVQNSEAIVLSRIW